MSATGTYTSTRTTSGASAPAVSGDTTMRNPHRTHVLDLVGGKRGAIDGGLPPLVFVTVNVIAGAHTTRPTALASAIAASLATGMALVALRLVRRETLKQALGGVAGLTVAVLFAVRSGEARGFFLPGIYVDAAYGVVFAGSALVGRPLVGTIYGVAFRRRDWRNDALLRRLFTMASFGWSAVYALRAGVQTFLYREDLPGLLAAGKLLLGWPLTVIAVALTLAAVRRATRHTDRDAGPG
jgi:Protein of unknown function (DUF3159)